VEKKKKTHKQAPLFLQQEKLLKSKEANMNPTVVNSHCSPVSTQGCHRLYFTPSFPQTLMPGGEVVSATGVSSSGEGKVRSRPFWARGGRCFACFLDPIVHGKKTPVPP
jgi:hypothetical protein